jgi:hypothetical protein
MAPPPAPAAPPPPAAPAAPPPSPVTTKFAGTLYGFAEFDGIWDSTQSFQDPAGNGAVAHDSINAMMATVTNQAAHHSRMQFGMRNSRFGYKLKGPETQTIKSSGMVEVDFLGNQPQGAPIAGGVNANGQPGVPTTPVSEAAFYTNPTMRVRHYYAKLETPFIDIMAGQYWGLFGWQAYFDPATVEIQGVPGEIFSRMPQLRLSKTLKTDDVAVDIAIAASRPPQRNSGTPDGQGGLRLALPGLKTLHTSGSAGTAIDPAAIGVSGVVRSFRVGTLPGAPEPTASLKGWGVSIDALIPIVPVTNGVGENALTLTGSFVYGQSIADLYTGLTGGAPFATVAAYKQDIDSGLVGFTSDGVLHAIRWQSYILGLQYYLPTPNKTFLAVNYSHMKSSDIGVLGVSPATNNAIFNKSDWFDANLFADANAAIRFGLEYAYFKQSFLDGTTGKNSRVQFSMFYIF